jgi:histidinol-phosphate phosphatase family protein
MALINSRPLRGTAAEGGVDDATGASAGAARRRAVFIDKDGTLLHDVPYNVDPLLIDFTPHAIEALKLLAAFDFALVVVTNQPGVALRYFDLPALDRYHAALRERLAEEDITLAGIYACPHAPYEGCPCRKPAPGLLQQAAQAHDIDLARSWMVGDILDDVEAGRRAGCHTVLLDVGHETVWRYGSLRVPHTRAIHLFDAARQIVAADFDAPSSIAPEQAGAVTSAAR